MTKNQLTTIATYSLLAAAGAVTVLMPRSLTIPTIVASTPGDEVILNGVLRDFKRSHPDFDVAGSGHAAGAINPWLPGTRRPLFVGGGFEVASQWTDISGRPIAPHTSGVRGGLTRETLGFRLNGDIELRSETVLDAFNSNYGPYGVNGNFGMDATITTNATAEDSVKLEKKAYLRGDVLVGPGASPATVIENKGLITGTQGALAAEFDMPLVTVPDDPLDLEPYQPVLEITGSTTLTGDVTPDDDGIDPAMHVGDLRIKDGAVLTIEGDLRIRCDRSLTIDDAQIKLLPDANLAIWVSDLSGGTGAVVIKGTSLVNTDEGDTTGVTINAIGTGDLRIENKTHVYATIVAPNRKLLVKNDSQFYGGLIADSLKVEDKDSGVHVDRGNASPPPSNFALSVREKIELDNAEMDAFDSNDGPYGGTNLMSNAWVTTNAIDDDEKVHLKNGSKIDGDVMIGPFGDADKVFRLEGGSVITGSMGQIAEPYPIPVVTPPAMGIPRVDEVVFDSGGSVMLESSIYCKKLKILNGTVVDVKGDITIRCDDKVEMKDGSEIRIGASSSLTMYVKKEVTLENNSLINVNTGNPQLCSIRMMSLGSKGKLKVRSGSQVCAWAQGAKSELEVEDGSEFFGSFTGKKAKFKNGAKMHVDMAYLSNCVTVVDTNGTYGAADDGAITSAATFNDWYRNLLGVNQTIGHPVTLTLDGMGVWEYLDDEFYPAEDALLGNEGEPHNNNFTFQLNASFDYEECGRQFIEFTGGDGAWLYVNGQLVMDIGGVRTPREQYVDIDRLGLEDGHTYRVSLFYAQRQSTDSVFRLRTNIDLSSDKAIPSVTAMFD